MKIIFATGNHHKLSEAQAILGPEFELVSPKDLGCHEDIPEDGNTFEANAEQKARYLWDRFGLPCFADDSGLEVDALHGAPGVFSARYAGPQKNDADNLNKLLDDLREVPVHDAQGRALRTARFRCSIALILNGECHVFNGTSEGEITLSASGNGGFGYDPIFRPEGYTSNFSELSAEEKNRISHRGRAMRQMADWLQQQTR